MRQHLSLQSWLLAGLAVLLATGPRMEAADKPAGRPNIVIILADDLGYGDLSCYGAEKIRTTACDRLAREGRRFTDAHTASAVCSPSRYGLLTGTYPWRGQRVLHHLQPNAALTIEPNQPTIAGLLKKAGYTTGCVGKWHLGFGDGNLDWNQPLRPGPVTVGFDYYFGVPTSNNYPPFVYVENDRVVGLKPGEKIVLKGEKVVSSGGKSRKDHEIGQTLTDKAVEFIERHKEQPFFLYFPTCAVHPPITPGMHVQGKSQAGEYGDYVLEFDWSVGRVLETLDRLKLADNTLVIVSSDNGGSVGHAQAKKTGHMPNGPLRGGKADIHEGGHRVPFIARWPGKVPAGTQCAEIICLTDLMASACTIVGIDMPKDAGLDSWNILSALLGEKQDKPIREATIHVSQGATRRAIRQGPWKLISGKGSGGVTKVPHQPNEPNGQLYNLDSDPAEQNNLYEKHPEIVQKLTELKEKYEKNGRSRP